MDPFQELTIGNASSGKENVRPADQVVASVNPAQIDVLRLCDLTLLVVSGPETALDLTADAFDCACGDDRLRRSANAEQGVDSCAVCGSHYRACHVAVGDHFDAGSDSAYFGNQVQVSRTVQDDHGEAVDLTSFRTSHPAQV